MEFPVEKFNSLEASLDGELKYDRVSRLIYSTDAIGYTITYG